MAKPRQGRHDEVMLIPFLDILSALIGVLILIIIVLSTAQLQRAAGRTPEEMRLARTYQELLKEKKELEKLLEARRAELAALQKRLQELIEKQKNLAEARKRYASSAEEARAAQLKAAAIQKEIDELKAQIEPIVKAMQPLQAEIEKLKQLLAEKKKKMDNRLATVMVRPSGSGARRNQRLFFIEANGPGIVVYLTKTQQLRVPTGSVSVDKAYNGFLAAVRNARNASLIFLVRRDGWWTYQQAAGWAEQKFGLNTGKLPIPGDGPVDLSQFEKRPGR
jgi:SHS2 domain-containing protein